MPFFLYLKNMKKNQRVYGRRKNTIEKKGLSRFLLDHPSFRLTRQIDWFTPGQLQAHILINYFFSMFSYYSLNIFF